MNESMKQLRRLLEEMKAAYPQRARKALEAFSEVEREMSAAESRGYERAREQAALLCQRTPVAIHAPRGAHVAQALLAAAERIRAMSDERAVDVPVVEQRDPTMPRREFMQEPPARIVTAGEGERLAAFRMGAQRCMGTVAEYGDDMVRASDIYERLRQWADYSPEE